MPSILDSLRPQPRAGLNLGPERWDPVLTHGMIPTPEPLVQYFHAREKAKARLAAMCELTGTPQDRVDAMLAEEAERECGIPTNISAKTMERVVDRLSRPRQMTARETVDYLSNLHLPRQTPEQRANARKAIDRLKALAEESPADRRLPKHGKTAHGLERAFVERLFTVPARPPALAVHVAKHREGPTARVDFRVSLDTLLATAEEPAR